MRPVSPKQIIGIDVPYKCLKDSNTSCRGGDFFISFKEIPLIARHFESISAPENRLRRGNGNPMSAPITCCE
jgi:hypothetical protein